MENITILLVEDDMIIAADISMQLTHAGYEVTAILARGEDALQTIAANRPDIVLMDVSLKGQLDGVETSQQIYDRFQVPVIFLTANHDDDTFERARDTRPFAFISKPFKRRDLIRAIELVICHLEEQKQETLLLSDHRPSDHLPFLLDDRIFVRYRDRMVKIYIHDILYVEAERSYCKILTAEKEYLMSIPLKIFEEKVKSDSLIRIHRSYVINLQKLDEISDFHVCIGKKKIPISKAHRDDLTHRLKLI